MRRSRHPTTRPAARVPGPGVVAAAALVAAALLGCGQAAPTRTTSDGPAPPADGPGYLMAHFTGEHPTGEQVYFAISTDGLIWTDLNGSRPVLVSTVGEQGVRDPALVRSPDGDRYWILATDLRIASGTGWGVAMHEGSTSLVVWESEDLVEWSEPRLVDVAGAIPDAGCAWAPEANYDPVTGDYVVYWATISPRDGVTKPRIYYARTTDFREFTPPALYIDRPGDQPIIDTQILPIDRPGAPFAYIRASGDRQITFEAADSILGTWTPLGDLSHLGLTGADVEGPILFQFNDGDRWGLYVDRYATGGGYLPLLSTLPASPRAYRGLPDSAYDLGGTHKRHGSILNLSAEELDRVRAAWGDG